MSESCEYRESRPRETSPNLFNPVKGRKRGICLFSIWSNCDITLNVPRPHAGIKMSALEEAARKAEVIYYSFITIQIAHSRNHDITPGMGAARRGAGRGARGAEVAVITINVTQ